MRFQKAKLVILLVGLLAFLAVAGRLAWFATKGKATILSPGEGNAPTDAVKEWWEEERRPIWDQQKQRNTPQERTPIASYAAFSTADVSGAEPPEPEKPPEVIKAPTGPQPYKDFQNVFVHTLLIGGPKFREDDRVLLSFDLEKARRASWNQEDKDPPASFGRYGVGEKLEPFPEITIEAIDPEENSVTFRMPKHKDPDPKQEYKGYQGNEEDSQTKVVTIAPPRPELENLGPVAKDENERLREEARRREEASAMRLRALDREATSRTEETFPGSGVWTVGTEDLNDLAEDYDERMRRDVTFGSYNKDGFVGVQIQRIKLGSVFADRGLLQNDVVLSLNEHPIPTPSEAIRYIRKHPEMNSYEIRVLRSGREKVLTYHVPR